MNSNIKFNRQSTYVDSLCVEDIGNCALEALDNLGQCHYIIVKTVQGQSYILSFGPVIPDLDELPKTFKVEYYYTQYNDKKLAKSLQTWAAGQKSINFEQINQISMDEALSQLPNIEACFTGIC